MVKQVSDGIFSIYVPLQGNPLKNLNAYYIKGKDRDLLVDTGFRTEACKKAILEGIEEAGGSMARADIFLTHAHSDHSGLAPELICGGSVYISEEDGRLLMVERINPERHLKNGFSREDIKHAGESPAEKYRSLPYKDYVFVAGGDKLTCGDRVLEVVSTPGHTPGHLCLYSQTDKVMILGDHVLFDITPNITEWPTLKNPLKRYLESLDKILEYDIDLPLPAHRGGETTVGRRIGEIKTHHIERLAEAERIVAEGAGMTPYQVASKMTWKIRASWEEFPIGQKWFAVGEAVAHLEYLVEAGRAKLALEDGVRMYSHT